jgi:two-component system sensor histidine kinase BaeS
MGCFFALIVALIVALAAAAGTAVVLALAGIRGLSPSGPGLAALFVVGLLVLLAGAGLLRGLRHLTRPVSQLVEAAHRIESGDYSARVAEIGPSEVRSVARAFNSMSARLEANEARRRGFLADVTHELRTPLALIRGQAEAIADGVYAADAEHLKPILDATRTLEGLIEDLRTLALSDAGNLDLVRERVDLRDLIEDVLAGFGAQAEAADQSLGATFAEEPLLADADPARLRSVLANLVGNALQHTPQGGSVTVVAARQGSEVAVRVEDTGEGIPAELLPRVFERFVKEPGSPGSGLGLAIARDIVTAHGGSIDIESRPGSGTTVSFVLPAADD